MEDPKGNTHTVVTQTPTAPFYNNWLQLPEEREVRRVYRVD
jgi:hypothetical protein